MAVYVISYQLRSTRLDYRGLIEEMERCPSWWHYLDDSWLVNTEENATQLYNRLAPYLEGGDSILIVQAGKDIQGWLPDDAWKWIERELVGAHQPRASATPAARSSPPRAGIVDRRSERSHIKEGGHRPAFPGVGLPKPRPRTARPD
jgi:hypothetical protein